MLPWFFLFYLLDINVGWVTVFSSRILRKSGSGYRSRTPRAFIFSLCHRSFVFLLNNLYLFYIQSNYIFQQLPQIKATAPTWDPSVRTYCFPGHFAADLPACSVPYRARSFSQEFPPILVEWRGSPAPGCFPFSGCKVIA